MSLRSIKKTLNHLTSGMVLALLLLNLPLTWAQQQPIPGKPSVQLEQLPEAGRVAHSSFFCLSGAVSFLR
jgi:hypothetical protein